jgi:hypothetical protein
MSEKSGAIVQQNDARVLCAFGEEVRIHLDGEHTAGSSRYGRKSRRPVAGHHHIIT